MLPRRPPLRLKLLSARSDPCTELQARERTVSLIILVRDGAASIRRTVESALAQVHAPLEVIVQDGGSSDGTIEILKSYGRRVSVVSEPDSGRHDRLWRALRRASGDFLLVAKTGERLLPGAVARGVAAFRAEPEAGAVIGNVFSESAEHDGESFALERPFDLLAYLCGERDLPLSATLLRRGALEEAGLFESPWQEGRRQPLDLEIWCRLGCDHRILHVPHFFASLTGAPEEPEAGEQELWSEVLSSCLFGADRFFGDRPDLKREIIRRRHDVGLLRLESGEDTPAAPPDAVPASLPGRRSLVHGLRGLIRRARRRCAAVARKALSPRQYSMLRHYLQVAYGRVRRMPFAAEFCALGAPAQTLPPVDIARGQFYAHVGRCFAARGQTAQALEMFAKAETINSAQIDAEACQIALASPDHDAAALEQAMRRWSFKHAAPAYTVYGIFKDRSHKRPITIGYHCIFWSSFCAEALALPFVAKHDRENFRIIGYSPSYEPQRIHKHFDLMRDETAALDSDAFARLVRSDDVDIFIELSGLSPLNRFPAMALRCAPIQASYVNHLATTQVANVDYVLGDETTFAPELDRYYSETIVRLPGCLLSFNYEAMQMPEITPPPALKTRCVTFGNFGNPVKLNGECLALWSAVMHAVPDSRFLIQNHAMTNGANAAFIRCQFAKHGIDGSRIITLPGTSRDENLKNYAQIDICLDTWPYCGGNSLAEPLWQGVPVVTLRGPRATSAYGASLVTAAGLSNLVAETAEEYVEIAVALARNPTRLAELRKSLRSMCLSHGLGDAGRMAAALEQAYGEMMDRRFGSEIAESDAGRRPAAPPWRGNGMREREDRP